MRGRWALAGVAFAASLRLLHASGPEQFLMLPQAYADPSDPLRASVSADGQFVAFASRASLLPSDSNVVDDVYVFDRANGRLTLESRAADGSASNGSSSHPALSADGRLLVFASESTNLTEGRDGNMSRDVFVRDRAAGVTRRISVSAAGHDADGPSMDPAISSDGLVVAFPSRATDLTPGSDANGRRADIYVVRLANGGIKRVSLATDGRQPSTADDSFGPTFSGDAHLVAFSSTASFNQRAMGAAGARRMAVFTRDLASGVTSCVSCDRDWSAFAPHMSADGRFVAFTSQTAARGSPGRMDIVLYDRQSSVATVVTRKANGNSAYPQISVNARFIVFQSDASNLECERRCPEASVDENLLSDIYRFDRESGQFDRVSGRPMPWWAPSVRPSIDRTGRVVVFSSRQPSGPEDMSSDFDLFLSSRESLPKPMPQWPAEGHFSRK